MTMSTILPSVCEIAADCKLIFLLADFEVLVALMVPKT